VADVHGDFTPRNDLLPFALNCRDDRRLDIGTVSRIPGQEKLGYAIAPNRWQLWAQFSAEELIWESDQNPSTITRLWVSTCSAAMLHVGKGNKGTLNDTMTWITDKLRDKSDAAGVVFVQRVV
jgi:hypothetical protein